MICSHNKRGSQHILQCLAQSRCSIVKQMNEKQGLQAFSAESMKYFLELRLSGSGFLSLAPPKS